MNDFVMYRFMRIGSLYFFIFFFFEFHFHRMCKLTFRDTTGSSKKDKVEAHKKCFKVNNDGLIYCIECEKRSPIETVTFPNNNASQSNRIKHIQSEHPSYLPRKIYKCKKKLKTGNICPRQFNTEHHLNRHQETKKYITTHDLDPAEIDRLLTILDKKVCENVQKKIQNVILNHLIYF